VLRTHDGPPTLLHLSRRDGSVVHRWTTEELARDVDLTTLTEVPALGTPAEVGVPAPRGALPPPRQLNSRSAIRNSVVVAVC
jgi:hypothetical protein